MQKIVSVVRSTRADYNIPNKTKTELHLEITCPSTRDTLTRYTGCVASTVQYSTAQYSTVQYSTVQYSTVQYSTV